MEGHFAIGILGTIRRYEVDFVKEIRNDSDDLLLQSANRSETFMNVGVGPHYENPKYSVGLAVPHIIRNDINVLPSNFTTSNIGSTEEIHAYLMERLLIPL